MMAFFLKYFCRLYNLKETKKTGKKVLVLQTLKKTCVAPKHLKAISKASIPANVPTSVPAI
jgi:hypothetical protein